MCMQRKDCKELLPLYPEPERTLHRLRREAHATQFEIMQNQEDEGKFQEMIEPQVDQMDRIVEIRPPDHLYNLIIRICLSSSPYHLQLFSQLYEDHPFKRTTLN